MFAAGLIVVAILAWSAYNPGLSGKFLFDDFANLPALGKYGEIDNWTALLRYLTSGFADPIGRPLSLLSFLLDARNWPADPEPFKRTSVLLHLLNGILLCRLLLVLGRMSFKLQRQATRAALLGAALWLLHPLWVSTTLYVVQREAMLPTTFILIGLLGYLHGRSRIAAHSFGGCLWISASLVLCTALAVLSKANGILLPVLVLTLEYAYLPNVSPEVIHVPELRRSLYVFAWPIALLIFVYLIYVAILGIVHGTVHRPWTMTQRLLTEPRVLVDYLGLLIAPRTYSTGLFNDGYIPSTDLFRPWTTLPALALIIGLIVLGFRMRQRHPSLALAILFFFAGHLIESTTIPLELYFEHRNYLPALMFFWPVSLWLTSEDKFLRHTRPLLALAAIALLSAETYFSASLWGNPVKQAFIWAAKNPDSPRAQTYAADVERSIGQFAQAEVRLRKALAQHPDEIQIAINLLGVRCQQGSISASDISLAENALRVGSNRGPITFDWIVGALGLVRDNTCHGLTIEVLQRLIDAAGANPQSRDSTVFQQSLLNLEGRMALQQNDSATAIQKFDAALKRFPKPDAALQQAALLGAHGFPQAGLDQLTLYRQLVPQEAPPTIRNMESLHRWLLYKDGYWNNEIAHLRTTLTEDLHKNSAAEKLP